jgi:hypothetical protein
MLCPEPMIGSDNGKPTPNLRLAADDWPMARPTYTYVLPIRLALALAFKQKVPELTITYEDAAEVIIDNLSKGAGASPIGESGSRFLLGCASTRMMCHADNPGRSCAARSRPTFQSNSPPSSILLSN